MSLADTGGLRAPLMALRPSICHQSSEDEGAASAGAHVISTICDSTHEALVRTKISGFVFFGGEKGLEEGEEEEALVVCIKMCIYKRVWAGILKCLRINLC